MTFWALVDLSPYGRPLAKEPPLPHLFVAQLPALPPLPHLVVAQLPALPSLPT